jgi:hypothetical protein
VSQHTCAGCDTPIGRGANGRRKWCGEKCRLAAFHRQFKDCHGESQSARYRRLHGRKDRCHEISCAHCGRLAQVQKPTARFCTAACAKAALRKPKPRGRSRRWWRAFYCQKRIARGHGGRGWPFVVDSVGVIHDVQPIPRRWKIPAARRNALYERDGWTCQLCGDPVDPESTTGNWAPTLDHIIPRSHGGDHSDGNLRLAHRWCNSVRGDLSYYTDDDLRVA